MNKIAVTITYNQYLSMWHLLGAQYKILQRRTVLFSGTKTINADLIAVSLLQSRYQFKHHVDDVFADYGDKRDFYFRLYEVAALSYFLSDCAGLPDHVDKLNQELKAIIKPHEYNQEKSDFQIWVEEKIANWAITYTELRDQLPETFNRYQDEYNSEIESKQDAYSSVEASTSRA